MMRKILFLFVLLTAVMVGQHATASTYQINDNAIDQLFDNAVETNMLDFNAVSMSATNASTAIAADGKDPVIALALDFFFGYLGIHRFYLGTEVLSGLLYPITCGGIFGIVPLIDLVMLIINYDDISPFVNNPSFFMWKDML